MANNNWRSKVNAMMTDQNYAAKAASVIGDTRSKNLKLMNKSAEDYPALSVGQQTKQPLDLARVPQMQQEQAARAMMDNDDEDYSGVADLATKLYAEERKASIDKANKQSNTSYSMTPHGMQFSSAASDIRAEEQAKNIQKIYGRVLENKTLYDAIHANANRVLLKAMRKNQSMTDDEKKKVYEKSVSNQLNAIGNSIDKYLYDVNAPKSELEWIAKNAINSSVMGQMLTSAGDVEGGENVYRQQAMADYGKDASWLAQGLSTAGSLIMDTLPMSGITTAIAQPVSRATMWGVGRIGGRALQNSILGKAVVGMAGGSATLGGYNAVSTLTTQFNNGYFNADELLSSTGHGLLLGGLTGGMSPWLRGASAGMGKIGKVATMASGLATEAGIFTASELSEMENPYDLETIGQVFGKNVAVIGGLKVSNLPKTIKEYKQWYTEGKQSNFSDADYKVMADFARANGYAADDAFTMSADGAYSRSIADRVTGNRTLLTMTKLQGSKEQNLAIEMYNDPNVPLSLKTKIAAKMNLPAPPPVLPNGVRVEGNKAITYYTMSNGQQQVIDIKEFDRPRKARAYANEFSRTTARRNDLLQSEASVNVMMSQPMVVARLNEQAKRNGTTLADEKARMDGILQRAADGTITQEDIAYYRSIVEDDVTTTESLKKDIKDKFGVEIDEVLNKEGNFTAAEDEALTAYGNALRGIIERGNPTTERTATAAMAGIEDYVALNNLGIEQTSAILSNPEQRAAIEQQTRSHYAAWLKFFDGKMGEDALAQKLGLDLNNTSDLQTFIAEQTYFKAKAADRIAYNTAEAAKQLLERGDGGVRFLDDGRVKLKGVPFAVEVDESIVARYEAAKQGSGEPMQRIVNDALKDIIKQSETPAEPKEPIAEETPIVEEPMTEAEAVTQQMVDARLAEIDTDLQGIDADGVQRMTINGKPAAIIKGRIVADENGQVDKTKSSAEVAYMLLDENGRPMLNEQGKPIIEVGVKPSNVHVEDIEQWRSVDDYKASEEQRIRDNNRITDEAMRQVDEQTADENQVPTEPKTADDLLAMCDGDKALALDVATDELAKAMQAKGKGATPAETIEINKRIRMYQQMVDRLSATEQPESASLPEVEQTEIKAEPQVTEDMEFVYQQGLDENHDGMEPMKMTDGRYKWVGLQRGELTATMGERDVELLDNLAKKLGVAVIPINVADRAVNGYYKDGNIYVNTNRGAEWTMRWVAGHEMLHDVAKKSPEAYDAYKQAVLDMWGSDYIESQVKQIIEDYKASGKQIDREQALTELVNDFGGELFSSRDGLKILDGILKDQSSKGNTGFIDTIKKWWNNIKEFFGMSPYANEVEKKLADAYKEAISKAEEFGKNYDFDYSIIGKRGAANLDKAEEATIRLDNLAVAREMESSGKDAKAIRMATGWERGVDNKWRYEIPDEIGLDNNGMVLNVAIDKAKWERAAKKLGRTVESLKSENDNLKAEVERRRMIPSIEKMLADNENTEDSHVRELKKSALLKKLNFYKSGLKYKDSDDVEKMWADLKDSIGKVDVLKLSEVLGADNALFKAYPELADIDVRFDDKGYTSVLATVSNDGKEIWMNPHNRESQSSVFLHEIQHLIQKIEGFAKGGSSRMFDIPEEHKYANMPGNVIKSMREQAEFARKKLSQYSTLEEIKEYYNANRSWLTGSEKDAIISVMDALIYGESVEDGISSLEKDYQQAIDDLNWSLTSKDSPYSQYTRLGGEVEARNAQNRMSMTEEERRNTLLSETEDVAREDQILLYSNLWGDSAKEFSISRKIDEKYPNWLEGTTTSSGKHSTQVAGTIGTYRKVGKWIKENLGNDIRILDASSGMGLGTEALRKDGMQIDDVEPYQSEERKKTNPATFSSYKDINGKYDFIISNAVLNVIPDDWRSNVLHDMVARLNNGGRLFINTRKAGEEKTIKDKIELDSPQEILVKRNGKIASYQRFFTPNELKEWVENELGEGYSVEVANEKNSGTKGLAAVVVRKLGEQPTDPNGGGKPTEDAGFSIKADKQKQLDIINRTNPAHDDYHTWIRTTDDIKTLQEAVDEVKAEDADYNLSSYPDVSDDMINEALQSGKIAIYSSKPIKEGVFVSPSQMQAKDYAGGGRIYSKQVPISDVAWINTDEGMFAPVEYSVKGKRADESVLDYAKRMSEETGKKNLLNGGSYFSGGGLLEEGLKGIVNPTIAVEFNQKVAGVYRNNFGEHIVTADVRNVDPASLVKNIDGPVAYFHASPVCKNFSRAKQSAEELPLDKATAQSTAEFISKVRPKIVTIENVKGYRDSESMQIILDELKKQGYNYDVDVYNAADYGAYTSRERLIVRAVRDWPLPAKPMMMLADDRPSGWLEAVADIIDTLPEKKGGVAKWMDERLSAMGIDYRNIDKPLYVFGSGYSKDRIGYAFADELVPTLRTKGGDVIVMPDGRVLKATPRVLARISGMSDEYEMPKTDDLAHTIVGNGIPVQLTKAVMGSLIENVKSDLDAGNTEYSIIGKRGAANLDKRDETSIRADNLATAEDMEKAGKDAKTIRMATGWERGADGKWRYEVKDLVMLPAEQWIGKRGKKLSDIVENADELFAAYPELANVKIKEGNGKTYGGSYSSGVITLDTYLAKLWMKRLPDSLPKANKHMNETLIHEIQHYIQEEEGFAKGGNESMVLDKDAVSRISALIDDSNKLATQYNNMIESGVYEGREAVKDEIIALRAKANAIRNSNRLGSYGYKSLAGEVEARNAEKRLRMTEEERKNSLLADTEDVDRDEQIVYGNTDDEYSIKIRGKEYRNDGYTQREDGTNVSIRALDAEESGTHSKGNFIKAYKVAKKDFDLLASLGVIKNTEWHHTGTNFAKTDFYSWADSQKADGDVEYGELAEIDPNSMAELYKKNKKEIGQLTDEYNNAKWGPLVKEREKLPTIEYITERYIRESNPEKYSLSDWLTKEEKASKSAEHEEISRGGEAYGTSYERRQMHEGVDNKYNKIAYDRKKEWAESHKDDIRRKYDEIVARVEKYNAEILPLEDVFANDAKGKPLMKLLEMFGYSADDAAKKIYHLQYQYYSNTIDERMAEASEKVRKEYDAKIESARVDFNKWLSKALKDGKAEFVERVPSEPENFITTKEEMNGRYGWFEASSRYNLPRYYSGYKFKTKRMYDSYKKREEDIFKIELEQISKTQEASNNVYNEYLKASHAVREDLVEKPLVQGDYSIKGGNTPERRADEVARLKQKIEQLSQEKDAIAEDGAKVKDIASEMTSFIKQNISTEVQSDMTRNQFKGILNQLENAVTKKDLEKPMQMIEYIGTNVMRRSLTRQMRNFLKSEFKSMTPQGAVKAKTVDGATSRVLELAKTMYATMNKLPLGGEVAALQKQMRDLKADAIEWANDQSADIKNLLADVLKVTERPAATRYGELAELRNKVAADGSASGEMLGYIDHMLDIMGDIDYFRGEQQKAKEASALNSKEDLEALKSELLDKSDKGILSEEDKAVLDNMPLYEAMLSLHQQQLNIDGPGSSSLAMQMKAKVGEIKEYGKKLDELDNKNSKTAIAYKTRIKEANNELQELFAARIVDQKAVNANVGELLNNLKEIRDTGKSKLQEWSKAKQERATRLVKMANESFGKDAKGYWSEVDKRGKLKKDFINWANNLRLSVLMSPAMSFEYMLGVMDPRYYTNNSPIYKQFIKSSEGLIKANDNFFEGTESYNMAVNEAVERFINRNAMTNLKEYFRRGDRFATAIIPFEVKVNRNGVDEYIPKEEMMTRGQAAKIYAWSRMADGMAKLKAHGVTDNTLTKVKEFIGEDYMNFIDWVEDEFFPRLRRERYNPVYKQMYGISMAENDHYFPFLIYQKDVRTEQELEVSNNDTLGGGVVGNLVERKRNNARLDFTADSPDIFDMITDYGRKMEEWAAYAQVREDLKKVINDKQFKQHCDELGTHYYKYFLEAAQVASRLSRDMAMTQHTQSGWAKAQKTIASAAISLRVSTALKQLLSAPAFMVYSLDPAFHHELIKTVQPIDVESAIKGLWKLAEGDMGEAKKLLLSENWVGHYNWCVENLPSFRERVTLKGAGNPILEEKGFFKFADDIQSVGMLPNRLVDAFTCSVGAKAIYEYAYKKYKKNYNDKTAHNMAVTDAEIAFNSSQQSSNPVFLAPMQVSKQFLLRGMMNYKNSPIGYYRNAMKASIDMYRATKAIFGQPKFTINGEVYGFENDGKNPFAMAAESGARASMFWLFLNLIWNFGTVGVAGLSYTMLNGSKNDDGNMLYTDEEIKKALGNDMGWALFNASNQGIPWVSGFASAAQTGQDYTPSILFSEMNSYVEQINKDGFMSMATAQIFTDLLLKNAAGVDPEVWGQIYRGAQGIMEDRPMRIEDFMNLIASPRSAISGVTKQRVSEYDRLRDYVNDRIASNRQLGVDERMTFGKKLTGMRELSKKSLGMYVDEYLADKIPGYREFANKPTEMEKEEEVANSNTLNAASSLYETIVRKEEEKEEKKDKIKDRSTKRKIKVLTKVANVIHKLCEVNDFETAERVANEMERRVKRGYNPDGETIEERLKNVDVWDSTGTTEQRSADGFSTAFDRARKGGFDSYLRRGKD